MITAAVMGLVGFLNPPVSGAPGPLILGRRMSAAPLGREMSVSLSDPAGDGTPDEPGSKWRRTLEEKFRLGGVLAGAYQYASLHGSAAAEDRGRGAFTFEPELLFQPTENDEFFVKLGLAYDDALNDQVPFLLPPWAADLEDTVRDVNGRDRNTLLTAGYRHTFQLGEDQSLSVTGGVIDATDFLDQNRFADDEQRLFMNTALVNSPVSAVPSYDYGGAAEWVRGPFRATAVGMQVGENEDGNSFTFLGGQVGFTSETALGEGNYRLMVSGTSRDFSDRRGEDEEPLLAWGISADQEFGPHWGGWIRIGGQDDAAAVDFEAIYSGGIDIHGTWWGRERDNIGLAYAELHGGNTGLDRAAVFEVYARCGVTEYLAVTLDVQYQLDDFEGGVQNEGWIVGARIVLDLGRAFRESLRPREEAGSRIERRDEASRPSS